MQTSQVIVLFFSLLYLNSTAFAEEKSRVQKKKTKELRWLSKSDQFVIYQQRKIDKTKKHFFTFGTGKYDLNGVSENQDFSFSYNYYFNENNAIGTYLIFSASSINSDIEKISNNELIFSNQASLQYGISYDWVPVYGKHLYKSDVFYTDIGSSFFLGLSKTNNNSLAVQNSDSSAAEVSVSSFDLGIEPFIRFFIKNKYFLKFSYRIRSSSLQESNTAGKASVGEGRAFISNSMFSFGVKI